MRYERKRILTYPIVIQKDWNMFPKSHVSSLISYLFSFVF